MNVHGIELIINLLSLIIAYLIVITFAGAFRAWFANYLGDDTAEELGLLTLNPISHIHFLGGLILLFFGFGWGRYVPINHHKIYGRFRILKICAAYFSTTFAHIFLSITVLTTLIFTFGQKVIYHAITAVLLNRGQSLQSEFTHAYPNSSSIIISLGIIGLSILFLSILLAVLYFLISVFQLTSLLLFENNATFNKYKDYLSFIVPFLMILLFIDTLRKFTVIFILYIGQFLANIFGII